jgi:hypothetical protein
MVQGITIGTFFSAEGFSLDYAKQRCSDVIQEWARNKNVALVGDMIFSPPHDYDDRTFLMYAHSDTEHYEPDPEL